MAYYIGIDPGQDGACVVLDDAANLTDKLRFAEFQDRWSSKLDQFLKKYSSSPDEKIVSLERVHSMPKQGVASTFTFGTGYGIVQGILISNGLLFDFVQPQTWMRLVIPSEIYFSTHDSKDKNYMAACQIFGRDHFHRSKFSKKGKRHDYVYDSGVVDASLIALYGLTKYQVQREAMEGSLEFDRTLTG